MIMMMKDDGDDLKGCLINKIVFTVSTHFHIL